MKDKGISQLLQQVSYELATAFLPDSAEKKTELQRPMQIVTPHKAATYLHCDSKKKKEGKKLLENEQADSSTEELCFPCLHTCLFLPGTRKCSYKYHV